MSDQEGMSNTFRARLIAALVAGLLIAAAQAQVQQVPYPPPAQPYPNPAPGYPNPSYPNPGPAYPNSGYPAPQPTYSGGNLGYPLNNQLNPGYPAPTPMQPQSHFFRDLFAGTLAAVLQTFSGGLIGAIGGRIMEWFSHKPQNSAQGYSPTAGYSVGSQYPNAGYGATNTYPPPASAYPNSAYPSTSPGNVSAAYPNTVNANSYPNPVQTYPPAATTYPAPNTAYPNSGAATPAYPNTAYPNTAYPNSGAATPAYPNATYPNAAYPQANSAAATAAYAGPTAQNYNAAPPQVYDARTGQMLNGAANPYSTRGLGTENAIYAGIAYEVHSLSADGQLAPIDTTNYKFHTGDKFMVYGRPSLPGHMEIYNVNPTGQQTLIDSSDMAAGQMVSLGPYQFTNQTGDESLRLVLSPCSSPQLLATTRDIVRVDAPPQAAPAVRLGNCSATASRGVDTHTRDIEKVGLEGTTSFALDPLSPHEVKTGQVAPREVTIVFHHL